MGFISVLLGERQSKSEVESFILQQSNCAACIMRQCTVLLKVKTVICNVFDSSQDTVVKYLTDSDVEQRELP